MDQETDPEHSPALPLLPADVGSDETTTTYRADPVRSGASASPVDGRTLNEVFDRAAHAGKPLPLEFVFSVYLQAVAALAEAVSRPEASPRLRPAFGQLGPDRIFVLSDGHVKVDWTATTPAGPAPGHRSYQSPEQARGLPFDIRSDIFSLTLGIAELLLQERLSRSKGSILDVEGNAELAAGLRDRSRIPHELGEILSKALATEAERRYQRPFLLVGDLNMLRKKMGLRADPSAVAACIRWLFPTPARETESANDRRGGWGSLDGFATRPRSATLGASDQLLPPPPRAPFRSSAMPPPHDTRPSPSSAAREQVHVAYPPLPASAESEPPDALARTLPPLHAQQRPEPRPQGEGWRSAGRAIPVPLRLFLGLLTVLFVALPFWKSAHGTVFTAAAGHLGQPLTSVVTTADGHNECVGARCTFDLAPGLHEISARAEGYVPQVELVIVRAREQFAVNFRLERNLPAGEAKSLGELARRAVGRASFDVRTPGAIVSLVSDLGRREPLDPAQPVELDLSRQWVLEAHKDGFQSVQEPLDWGGNLEKTFVVALDPKSALAAPASIRAATPRSRPCSVTFNTIPMSTVSVDGVRLGATPVLAAAIRPGPHAAQFLTGDVKRSKPFACRPGESKVVTLVLPH
jgi:hypothetical protein